MLVVAILLGAVVLANAVYLFFQRRFSSLYWFSVLIVFSFPAVMDLMFGLPAQRYEGLNDFYFPYVERGMRNALWYSAGHIIISSLTYHYIIMIYRGRESSASGENPNIQWWSVSGNLRNILWLCFWLSGFVIIYFKFDLSQEFNIFLKEGARAEYQNYFWFASTPLIAILMTYKKNNLRSIAIVSIFSVIVAYFTGIRYYMFPFIGYVFWQTLLSINVSGIRRLLALFLVAAMAWTFLTLWGIVRREEIREQPLTVLEKDTDVLVDSALGNELGARLAYYNLLGMPESKYEFRGYTAVRATVLSAFYPALLQPFDIEVPISNSKRVFEIVSDTKGTGISIGTTVFGNDWFNWGWSGFIVGGVFMGLLLSMVDVIQDRKGSMWILLSPMMVYQLIFFARGGTDVWLGLWGRFLPLTILMFVLAHMLDELTYRTLKYQTLITRKLS